VKVKEKLNKGKPFDGAQGKPTISFEFFPPKNEEQEKHLFEVLKELQAFKPDFASVTYGALGTTRERSFHWIKVIKEKFNIEPVAHLTCVAATKDSIAVQLNELEGMGVENILALRGDPPEGSPDFTPPPDGFRFAKELAAFIKKNKPNFCLGVAGFPEDQTKIGYLMEKIAAGGEYVITQLFFDNRYYFDFVKNCRKAGIVAPIIPGIMPIVSLKQIKKMTKVCGASIPLELFDRLEAPQADVEALGVEYAIAQCRELLNAGVPGIHFFVMNQSGPISAILKNLPF